MARIENFNSEIKFPDHDKWGRNLTLQNNSNNNFVKTLLLLLLLLLMRVDDRDCANGAHDMDIVQQIGGYERMDKAQTCWTWILFTSN